MPTKAVELTRQQRALAIAESAIAEMSTSTDFDYEEMLVNLMEADSADALFDSDVTALQDIIGVPITIHSAILQKSDYEAGFMPVYAVMRVTYDGSNEQIVVTTGATQVVAACVKAHSAGWFPLRVSTKSVTTSKGNTVVKLVRPPAQMEGV